MVISSTPLPHQLLQFLDIPDSGVKIQIQLFCSNEGLNITNKALQVLLRCGINPVYLSQPHLEGIKPICDDTLTQMYLLPNAHGRRGRFADSLETNVVGKKKVPSLHPSVTDRPLVPLHQITERLWRRRRRLVRRFQPRDWLHVCVFGIAVMCCN